MKKILLIVTTLLAFMLLACGFNFSTANISDAKMALDAEGASPTTVFGQEDVFYAVVTLDNAPDDTTVKASWVAVEAEGVDPGLVIDEVELTSGSGQLQFDLSNDKLWPVGKYKVDLLLNGEPARTLEFEVQGEVAAEPEPEEEPTATPEPEPTATPEPVAEAEEPAEEPVEEEPAAQNSAGDSLGDTLGSTVSGSDEAEAESAAGEEPADEPEPIPLQADEYVHPSGAFSLGVPEGWELYNEDELSAEFGDDRSRYGVVFVNPGFEYDGERMAQFVSDTLPLVVDTFAQNHEIISEDDLLEDSGFYYVAVSFNDGNGLADFFYEQHDTIVYVFYFASLDYTDVKPTRDSILDTYSIDEQAALEALPAEEPTPAAAPPTATPKPAPANPYKPPAGVARVFLQNEYGNEYNVDFGDGSGSIQVPPGAQNFFHDVAPGKYRPGLSLPGGGATNVEFDIQADQAYVILVTADLGVRWGQVYP
ncbi:MAG: hypothetical protein Kow0031_01240 [Anaerolineae bacterium]